MVYQTHSIRHQYRIHDELSKLKRLIHELVVYFLPFQADYMIPTSNVAQSIKHLFNHLEGNIPTVVWLL